MKISVNRERLIKEFSELTAIDSVSFGERKMADRLIEKLKVLGFEIEEDRAGNHYGGNAGNIYGFLKGYKEEEPILFSSHMDTVSPGISKKAVLHKNGTITSDGTTILGADDIAGLVEILEGIRSVKESGVQHKDIEILFPIAEEAYLKGTNKFDFKKIKSKQAYVLDVSGDVGAAVIKAPSLISFKVTVTGKASHAGFAPENGINAIEVTSRAISCLQQGHIDEETTLNIGTISGGTAANIISETCECSGEVRSFQHQKALSQIQIIEKAFLEAAANTGADISIETSVDFTAYELDENEPVIQKFLSACSTVGINGRLISTFGGSDNHNFVLHGIKGTVISCGMYQVHSVHEYTRIDELVKGAELVAQLIINE